MKNEKAGSKILKNQYIPTAEFYSQVIDSLQDYSIFTMDKELLINSWSSGSAIIFGYPTEEVIGQPFDIIFTEEDKKNKIPEKEIALAFKEGRAVDNRWHLCKNGSIFFANGLVFPLTGIDGELLGFVKILRDLTEKKNSENAIKKYVKELEDLNLHKENILAILSHDLRSPLNSIIGSVDYLKTHFDTMEHSEVKKLFDMLYKSSVGQLNMLDYLVEWARIKYASEAFSPAKIELVKYVEKVFATLNDAAVLNTINLHHEIKANETVIADEKMLLSILQNLVSNAIKHSHPGGKITVSAQAKDDKVIVQIKDTGVGMSKEIQEKLFTPQLDALSKARIENKGAGIGLFLVKGFLEKNGGEIWVESEEGNGSSFYFTLPVNESIEKSI